MQLSSPYTVPTGDICLSALKYRNTFFVLEQSSKAVADFRIPCEAPNKEMVYTLKIPWSLKEQKGDELGTECILLDFSLSTSHYTNAEGDDSFQIRNRYMPDGRHTQSTPERRETWLSQPPAVHYQWTC